MYNSKYYRKLRRKDPIKAKQYLAKSGPKPFVGEPWDLHYSLCEALPPVERWYKGEVVKKLGRYDEITSTYELYYLVESRPKNSGDDLRGHYVNEVLNFSKDGLLHVGNLSWECIQLIPMPDDYYIPYTLWLRLDDKLRKLKRDKNVLEWDRIQRNVPVRLGDIPPVDLDKEMLIRTTPREKDLTVIGLA